MKLSSFSSVSANHKFDHQKRISYTGTEMDRYLLSYGIWSASLKHLFSLASGESIHTCQEHQASLLTVQLLLNLGLNECRVCHYLPDLIIVSLIFELVSMLVSFNLSIASVLIVLHVARDYP